MKPVILGNSHALSYSPFNDIRVMYFGAATAFNLIHKKSTTNSFEQLNNIWNNNSKDEILIFHFGSIDCRIHVYLQHKRKGIPISELIDKTILNYLIVLNMTRAKGFDKVVVHGVIPEKEPNVYGYEFYSEDSLRKDIFIEFNNKLKEKCKKHNFPYFDLYQIDGLIGEDGFLHPDTTSDMVHIDMIKFPKFKEHLDNWLKEVFK